LRDGTPPIKNQIKVAQVGEIGEVDLDKKRNGRGRNRGGRRGPRPSL